MKDFCKTVCARSIAVHSSAFSGALRRRFATSFGSSLFVMLIFTSARAQVQRTFVSGGGSDGNPCNRTAPCRTFGQAILGTSAGGEVIVLDSAGYGPFAITQAVSITAPPGVYAGISVFSGDGIDINAGPSDTVILRGLTINNQGSSGSGIVFNTTGINTGGILRIESCIVSGFASSGKGGILFNGGGTLEVKDSALTGNYDGISVAPGGTGTAKAAIDNVRLEDNSSRGLVAHDLSIVTVRNSLASGNGAPGFFALSTVADGTQLNLERCLAINNLTGIAAESDSGGAAEINVESCVISRQLGSGGVGIGAAVFSGGSATVRVSNSMVTDNNVGLEADGGSATVLSRVNNTVEGNTTNQTTTSGGTIITYSAK
jgi:hypothetical protein